MQNVECRIIRHIIGLYSNSAFIIHHSVLIIPIVFLLLILQVLQRLRFHIDGKVPALVAVEKVNFHFGVMLMLPLRPMVCTYVFVAIPMKAAYAMEVV